MKLKLFFAWYDIWIGFYYDRKNRVWYFCPLPMLVLMLTLPPKRIMQMHCEIESDGTVYWNRQFLWWKYRKKVGIRVGTTIKLNANIDFGNVVIHYTYIPEVEHVG